ncbi:MAG: hypothetical protein ABIP94_04290 [Planctomycetota bacterium]
MADERDASVFSARLKQRVLCVDQQIEQHLLDLVRASHDLREVGGHFHLQGYSVALEILAGEPKRTFHDLEDRRGLRSVAVVASELQQVAHDHRNAVALLLDDLAVGCVVIAVQDQLRAVDDGVDRVVDFVRDAGSQFSYGGQPLGLRELGLHLLTIGDVADDAGEEAALVDRSFADGQVDRKLGAVLALADHFAADADDAVFAGAQVALQVAVVLAVERFGH